MGKIDICEFRDFKSYIWGFSDSTAKMRCRQRKQLFIRRNKVCDFSLLLAFIGLILVVIDAELTALDLISKVGLVPTFGRRPHFCNTKYYFF